MKKYSVQSQRVGMEDLIEVYNFFGVLKLLISRTARVKVTDMVDIIRIFIKYKNYYSEHNISFK